ncbi:hypothetical protein MBLNU457_1673t1 [Dothideomycetes sp. NU457]
MKNILKAGTAALAARQFSALSSLFGGLNTVTSDVGEAINDITSGVSSASSKLIADAKQINGALTGAGLSPLGLASLNLPPHLSPQWPWGNANKHTNYYDESQVPNTGKTRTYDWTITKGQLAPDGVEVTGFLINGQFPGPVVEADWGDYVQVTVHNAIEDEGTTIHWHGVLQKNTQTYDGVPGVSQCPIAPGQSLTYTWRASLYGSSWYHSHYSSQYGSGIFGPIVIYGPKNYDYDIDVGPIMVGDWYHQYYEPLVADSLAPIASHPTNLMPALNNILINGKNSYPCQDTSQPCVPDAGLASFNLTTGKSHRLRLINPSAAATVKISLDGHKFQVIANDFVPIEAYETDVVTLGVGQRTDVIINATGNPGDAFYLRAFAPPNCWVTDGTSNNYAQAIVYNQPENGSLSTDVTPSSQAQSGWDNQYCGNDPLSETVPTMKITPGDPEYEETIVIQFQSNGTHLLWYQNDKTMRVDFNDPILLEAKNGSTDFPFIRNVYDFGANKSVRLIFENHSGMVHPMHLHGHNMFILSEGYCQDQSNLWILATSGVMDAVSMATPTATETATASTAIPTASAKPGNTCWNGDVTNPSNPQRRDVQQLVPGGYLAVQWNQDNPGAWPLHCHIAWHISQGFGLFVLEQPEEIMDHVTIPQDQVETCRNWWSFTNHEIIDVIDSGV